MTIRLVISVFFIFIPFTSDGTISLAWQSVHYTSCGVSPWTPFSLHLLSPKPTPSLPPFCGGLPARHGRLGVPARQHQNYPSAFLSQLAMSNKDTTLGVAVLAKRPPLSFTPCTSIVTLLLHNPFVRVIIGHARPKSRKKSARAWIFCTRRSSDSHGPARRKPLQIITLRVGW